MNRSWSIPAFRSPALVAQPAHGLVVTSATLTDGAADPEQAWRGASLPVCAICRRPGRRLHRLAVRLAAQTGYSSLPTFRATTSGRSRRPCSLVGRGPQRASGLFTAIARLRAVRRASPRPSKRGVPARPARRCDVDVTLVDIFRAEEDSASSAPTPCATASTSRPLVATARHRPSLARRTYYRARKPVFAGQNMASGSPGCGYAGLKPAHPPRRRSRHLLCSTASAPAERLSRRCRWPGPLRGDRSGCRISQTRIRLDSSPSEAAPKPHGSRRARPPPRADLHDGDRVGSRQRARGGTRIIGDIVGDLNLPRFRPNERRRR